MDVPDEVVLHSHAGLEVAEIGPWRECDELWRGLEVRFLEKFASHALEQEFHFGHDVLLRRVATSAPR